jgi:hypothetical protein
MTIAANTYPAGGDAVEAAKRYNETLSEPRKPKR